MHFWKIHIWVSSWAFTPSVAVCSMQILHLSDLTKEIFETSWEKSPLLSFIWVFTCALLISSSLDSVSLSRPCLSIGKDWAIVSLQTLINNRFSYYLEYFFLRNTLVSNVIKRVGLLCIVISSRHNYGLLLFDISNASSFIGSSKTKVADVVRTLLKWCISSKVNICLGD